jgi:iron complex outermembrane receptor protein
MKVASRDPAPHAARTVLASTVSALLAGGGAAYAQDASLEEITVTGSRIVRRDLDAPSPIMTLDAQRLEQTSTLSMESVLNQMPQFIPSGTQFVSGGVSTSTQTPGIASVNLRGIGTNRTLVLVDGRRPQPANAALVVDLNTIPAAAIERVETITGGASAVYGPDALAGVVNFVLKSDFEGFDADYQFGQTQEGDGTERRFTSLFGMNSADGRGNVMVGIEYYDREVVWQRDRDFYREGWYDPGTNTGGFLFAPGFSFAGQANRPTQAAVDALWQQHHGTNGPVVGWGLPGVVQEIYFNPDGSPFVIPAQTAPGRSQGFRAPIGSQETGGGYAGMRINPNGSVGQINELGMASTPQERRSMFGRARYDVTDNLTAIAQLTYSNNTVTTTGGIPPAITVWQAHIPNDGRTSIPAGLQSLLDSRPLDAAGTPTEWRLFRGMDFWGENFTTDNSNDVYQILAGLEGRLANDWTWEVYGSTGRTDTRNDYRYLPSLQRYRWLAALPEFGAGDATGLPGFAGQGGQAGLPPVAAGSRAGYHVFGRQYVLECSTGLPIFGGYENTDPACFDSIDSRARAGSVLTQDIVEFNLQGKIADMRAGELRFAAGAAYRDNEFRFEPLNDNRTISDHPIGIFVSDNTAGEMNVREVYGELLVPITQRLSAEFGYRYSEFNTAAGDVNTWKALFDYAATDNIRFRGGFQAATRAPNTAEMFQGPTMFTVPFAPSDPCQASTRAPWGNGNGVYTGSSVNPRRLEIQQLCYELIGNPNTPFGVPGSVDANNFVRPGLPFFASENVLERGNTDLRAENADTWTFGAVFTGLGRNDGITASIDMYNIEMSDVISPISPVFVYEQCFNANGTSNPTLTVAGNPYCSMIGRQPITGERDTVQTPFVNQGALNTAGVDVTVTWVKDFDAGSFSLNSVVSVLNEFELQDSPTQPFLDARGTLSGIGCPTSCGQFEYRLNTTAAYSLGDGKTNVGLRWFHLPAVEDASALRPPTTLRGTGSYSRFDAFAGYQVSERISLRGGIDNLLDEQPRVIGAQPGNNNAFTTNAQWYDILGRRAYIGMKMQF